MNMHHTLYRLANIVIDKEKDLDIPDPGDPSDATVQTIVDIAFIAAASIAAIVIVIAGINFILSRGDPQRANNARNAIIYSLVGLGIITVAFSIVRLVVRSV